MAKYRTDDYFETFNNENEKYLRVKVDFQFRSAVVVTIAAVVVDFRNKVHCDATPTK